MTWYRFKTVFIGFQRDIPLIRILNHSGYENEIDLNVNHLVSLSFSAQLHHIAGKLEYNQGKEWMVFLDELNYFKSKLRDQASKIQIQ